MNNIIIKSKTIAGKNALKQGLAESTFVQKKLIKEWYTVEKVRDRPFTIKIIIKLPLLAVHIVEAQIEDILTQNGAERDKDYVITRSGVA